MAHRRPRSSTWSARGERFEKLHFLVFPEGAVPAGRLDDTARRPCEERFRPSTVTMFGLEHVPLRAYRDTLRRFRDDNAPALAAVEHDLAAGARRDIPVNLCCVVVKEASGRLRVFLEAKGHPFHGEEFLDKATTSTGAGTSGAFRASQPSSTSWC